MKVSQLDGDGKEFEGGGEAGEQEQGSQTEEVLVWGNM